MLARRRPAGTARSSEGGARARFRRRCRHSIADGALSARLAWAGRAPVCSREPPSQGAFAPRLARHDLRATTGQGSRDRRSPATRSTSRSGTSACRGVRLRNRSSRRAGLRVSRGGRRLVTQLAPPPRSRRGATSSTPRHTCELARRRRANEDAMR
jgi:hypothetical protein